VRGKYNWEGKMKRILLVCWMFVLLCGLVFAGGKQPEEPPVEIVAVGIGGTAYESWISAFEQETGAVVVNISADISAGSTVTMDVLLAAKTPPHIYNDFTGRSSKFMVTEGDVWTALDLSQYIDDLDDYFPGILATVTRDGKVIGLPQGTPAQGMAVNLDILKEAGYALKTPWTADDFKDMCKAVSRIGKYGTSLFAANPSGDYVWMNWFAAFGAKMYTDGDYSKTTINSPEGVATFRYWKELLDAGYMVPESAVITDDDYVQLFITNKIAAGGFRSGWVHYYTGQAIKQGLIREGANVAIVEFPRGPGVTGVPSIGTGNTVVVRDSGDEEINRLASRLAWYITNTQAQLDNLNNFPTRKSVKHPPNDDVLWNSVAEIVNKYGMMDVGYTLPQYYETRGAGFPILQGLLQGKLSPEEAAKKYADTVNEILK